jgi:hypothetical protein
MTLARALAVVAILLAACAGEEDRPEIDLTGLHQDCPDEGCLEGQECVTAAGPGGDTMTCEIPCEGDGDCPRGTTCLVPPVLPEQIPHTCAS